MDRWQCNPRMIHHINEFLDLDSAKSNLVDEFIALFNAIREGLTHIDDDFHIPDSQINMLFLSKLKSRPEWAKWTGVMMRDPRINGSDPCPTERTSFCELARLARERERMLERQRDGEDVLVEEKEGEEGEEEEEDNDVEDGDDDPPDSDISLPVQAPPTPAGQTADYESEIDPMGWGGAAPRIQTHVRAHSHVHPSRFRALTQDEINAFVVQKMDQESLYRSRRTTRGHMKRPSQEEINQYVVEQMSREQDRRTRMKSYSQPESRAQQQQQQQQQQQEPRCRFCCDLHPTDRCWRRWRVAVEAPQANLAPKRVEFRTEVPEQLPIYQTGFIPY